MVYYFPKVNDSTKDYQCEYEFRRLLKGDTGFLDYDTSGWWYDGGYLKFYVGMENVVKGYCIIKIGRWKLCTCNLLTG